MQLRIFHLYTATFQHYLHMDYIFLSWYDIPELVVPIRKYVVESAGNKETTEPGVPISYVEVITLLNFHRVFIKYMGGNKNNFWELKIHYNFRFTDNVNSLQVKVKVEWFCFNTLTTTHHDWLTLRRAYRCELKCVWRDWTLEGSPR